jgi:ABC-type transport system substrate-binding protein
LSSEDSVIANSFLTVSPSDGAESVRVLNYLQTMDSNFVLIGQESARVVAPEESLDTFIASSNKIDSVSVTEDSRLTWRVQFRKGVYESSGNGVTTLVDVQFTGADIQ